VVSRRLTRKGLASLIFTEHEAVLRPFTELLKTRGHEVRVCSSPRRVERAFSSSSVDLLVLHWTDQRGPAAEVCRRLVAREKTLDTLILALVGPDGDAEAIEALGAGAHDVASWPAADQHLVEARLVVLETRLGELRAARQTEDARQLLADRFSLVGGGSADGLWDWDLTDDVFQVSTRWKEILTCGEVELAQDVEEWLSRVHPDDVRLLRERLDAHLRGRSPIFEAEHRLRCGDGSYLWVVARGAAARDGAGGARRIAGSLTDVSARKAAEEQLLHEVAHDPLTGLPSRARFMDRLQRVVDRARRHGSAPFAVLFLDLDRFKLVNDGLGHLAGDRLLVATARRIEESLRPADTVARLGGDEFAVILDGVEDPREATIVAERIRKALHLPFDLDGQEVYATASIGIAPYSDSYQRAEELLRDADTAMYRAKATGRDRYAVFDRDMHERAVAALQLENDLRRALDTKAFTVHYQPVVSLRTGRIVGFEALVRWQHPQRGLVMPTEFIHVAEETGLIIPIGRWVASEACRQLRAWQVQFRRNPPLTMSINVSGTQFMQPDLPMQIDRILRENGLYGSTLKLEITESVIMEKARYTDPMLEHLRDLSIRLSIDDFGTGYSSLSYLRRFEIDTLKIDSSFVSKITQDDESSEIVRAIVSLAHNLGKDMIAEGVETASQLALLEEMDCTFAQGYYFSRPLAALAATNLLASDPRWQPARRSYPTRA
jgi:diguanylate cyclase (GGDEF)-like protein/PAS domain S-box-containing protein